MRPTCSERPTRLPLALPILLAALVIGVGTPVFGDEGYRRPPQVLADIVEVPPTPSVSLSPDRSTMLMTETPSLLELADLARGELRLAGIRFSPTNGDRSRNRYVRRMWLQNRETLAEREIDGLTAEMRIDNIDWSPDSRSIAFTVTDESKVELWIVDVASARARRLIDTPLNAVGGNPLRWMPDSSGVLVAVTPVGRGEPPNASTVPRAPVIQENAGKVAPARTYQDLLQNAHDADLFEYYMSAQLVRADLDGTTTKLGPVGLLWDFNASPDGRYLLVEMMHRPFSYLVPLWRFPNRIEIWDAAGKPVKLIADLPLRDQIPTAFGSVATGPRSVQWRDDKPATVFWVEARDGGDARAEAEVRDELLTLDAPFDGRPESMATLGLRYGGVRWGDDDLALVSEFWWKTRKTRTWVVAPGDAEREPELLFDRSYQDRYSDPGRPVTVPNGTGGSVLLTAKNGRDLFFIGDGASPEGNRPFYDRMNLKTKETERLWQSEAPFYERPVTTLDVKKGVLLTRRESPDTPPNYFTRELKSGKLKRLTDFPHPTPQLEGISKELLRYDRKDGVQLTGTLYLPAGYDKERDGRLPLLVWAYPREFKSASDAGQVRDSPYQFDRVGWWSPLVFLSRGYAVLDDATMPIVGEGEEEPNDTYVEQLVASAAAAIDTVVEKGVADRTRTAVGGHSYGAFMTANLLAHSDLFAAGIARSGAYNRTLTPFGFQAEERTVWEAPDIYFEMSPFMHAEKVDEPILLIHGDADNNSGTFPLQSKRFYHALKGLGGTARLVMLPEESHGYRARESVLHMLWEMDRWLDLHVKEARIETASGR